MSQLDLAPLDIAAEYEVAAGQLSSQNQPCTHCHEPATQKCSGCSVDPFDKPTVATYYCSKACLVADRPCHQLKCLPVQHKARLWRAGHVLQTIFYSWRQITFDDIIDKVEEKQGKRLVHTGSFSGIENIQTISYVPLPTWLALDDEQGRAVLALQACNDATYFFRDLTLQMLRGMDVEIAEQDLWLRRAPYQTQLVTALGKFENKDCNHSIMIIKLKHKHGKSSEQYSLDLSGAQYGIKEPIESYATYKQNYGVIEGKSAPVGTFKYDHPRVTYLTVPNHKLLAEMNLAISQWVTKIMKLPNILKLNGPKYLNTSTAFTTYVHQALTAAFDKMHAPGGLLQKFMTYSFPAGPRPRLKPLEVEYMDRPVEEGEEPGWYVKAGPSKLVDSLQDYIEHGKLKGDDDHARPSREPKASTPRAATDNGTAMDDAGEFVELVMPDGFKMKVRKSTTIMNFPM